MFKLMGSILIIFSAIIYGFNFAKSRRKRLSFLEEMDISLGKLKSSFKISKAPVYEAFYSSGCKDISKALSYLTKEDNRDFECFYMGLEAETEEELLKNIEIYKEKLSFEREKEKEKYAKELKLIRGWSILCGILICIILL